ncbi:Leucine-rich repeat-containing protein 43 [Thoreauomyces humboldtii]|nr:Leucine-rich repeat-containing protein 43 [Thoreauomyces humboldtii]
MAATAAPSPAHDVTATRSFFDLLDTTTGIRPRRSEKSGIRRHDHHAASSSDEDEQSDTVSHNHRRRPHDPHRPRTTLPIPHLHADPIRAPTRRAETRWHVVLPPVGTDEELLSGDYAEDAHVDVWASESLDWSPEAGTVKTMAKEDRTRTKLASHFRTLLLHDRGITTVDPGFKDFRCLETLSLTGNRLGVEECTGIPASVRVLSCNANGLPNLPVIPHLTRLVHLGLTHNRIESLASCTTAVTAPDLLSLDVSWNRLHDLEETIRVISRWAKLKSLVLMGNPIFLLPNYRRHIQSRLASLTTLDDVPVETTANARTDASKSTSIPTTTTLRIRVTSLINPPLPVPRVATTTTPPIDPSQPADVHAYQIQIRLGRTPYHETTTPSVSAVLPPAPGEADDRTATGGAAGKKKKKDKVEEVVDVDAVRRFEVGFETSVTKQVEWTLADALKDGMTLTLLQTRQSHVAVAPPPPAPSESSRPGSGRRPSISTSSSKPPASKSKLQSAASKSHLSGKNSEDTGETRLSMSVGFGVEWPLNHRLFF